MVTADHMPTAVSALIGESLRDARDRLGLDGFALLRIDPERAALIDDIGGCERDHEDPAPAGLSRRDPPPPHRCSSPRSPFALVARIHWFTPLATVLIALPLLAIDKIGTELQDPFSKDNLNHLPLDDICATIERNLLAMLDQPITR